MKIRIRIQGFLIFLAIATTILLSKFLFPYWKEEALDEFLDALGIGLVLWGFLFRIAARGHKAEKSSQGKKLITDGPYGLIRNPMYFGTLLIGLGINMVIFAWWAAIIFFIIFLSIYIRQIRREEADLSRRFGEEYKNYCKVTSRYFPRIFNINLREHLFFKWPWIQKELPSLIGVMGVIIVIEAWEDIRLFGYNGYRKELLELPLIIICFIIILGLFYEKKNIPRED